MNQRKIERIPDPIRTLHRDLKTLSLNPNSLKGQNFLISPKIRDSMCLSAKITAEDFVIEIGPGTGILTARLIELAGKVVALEIEQGFVLLLKQRFHEFQHFQVEETDAVKWLENVLANPGITCSLPKIVSNLPFGVSSPVLLLLSRFSSRISNVVLMLQEEVGQRVMASPGQKERGLLSVMVQLAFRISKITYARKAHFWPVPKVDSVVLLFEPRPPKPDFFWSRIFDFVKVLFLHKRKTLLNNLRHYKPGLNYDEILASAGISKSLRAEALTEDQIISLFDRVINLWS